MKQFLLSIFLALFFITGYSQVVINEYSTSNLSGYLDNYQKTEDWIELHNTSGSSVDISGYYLSDKQSDTMKWQIPSGTSISANGYLVFWCSGRDELSTGNFHTNFKLKQTKSTPEHVILSDASGTIINDFEIQKTQVEHSYGRISDGSSTWGIFTSPTLGIGNNGTSYTGYAQKPEMSLEAGHHSGTQSLDITTAEPNATIYYTNNGNLPHAGTNEYTGTLNLSSTQIVKAIVVADDPDILPSFLEFNTFFINESHTLPIISSSANQMTTLLNGDINLRPHGTIEYFDADGVRQDFGYGEYNKHGQDSWQFPQRSFDYIARDEMGYHEAIQQRLMNLSDRDSYQKIIVRASGDDNYPGIDSSAHMRDVFIHKLANKNGLNVDMRRGERCVVYANGQYWGVYSIREKVSDSDYTKYYYDQDKYNTQYLMNWGYTWAQYGGDQAFLDWDAIHDFALSNDLSVQSNYQQVADEIDVTSLVDYILINSYVVCTDWINWNTSWWRGIDSEGSHKKWGYVLWDEDATFNHYINYTNVPNENADADPCYPEGINLDPEEQIVLLNRLLDNEEFTQYYITRYMDLMNTAFAEEEMISVLEGIENSMIPEMPQHFARWGGNMGQWQANVQKIKDFIQDRNINLPDGLNDCYDLSGPYDITLEVEPANTGNIEFNSLTLNNADFPWTGSYHGGVDMLIKAVPANSGFVFDHWEIDNHTISDINAIDFTLLLTQNDNIKAVFAPVGATDIIINEINYNDPPDFEPKDWVELYNSGDTPVDISNWVFKDSDDAHEFIIPDGTVMQPDTYLVLAQTLADFQALLPTVNPVIGDFEFGLSGGGELIRLFDDVGTLIDSVDYDDDDPWPVEADGNGPTLELINPDFDNSLAASWQACDLEGLDQGSPGAANNECNLSVDEFNEDNTTVYVFPNPMKSETTILLSSNVPSFSLTVFDILGREVFNAEVNSNRYVLKKNSLNAGTYFLNIKISQQGSIQTKKLIID